MRIRRILLLIVLVVVALALQISALPRLHLPGAVPDTVLLVVICTALLSGPLPGSVTGFCAGLALDLVPPADHAAGREAFAFCLVGYLVGLIRDEASRSVPLAVGVAGFAAGAATLVNAALGVILRETGARHAGLGELLLTAILYEAVLAGLVLPFILARRRRRVRSDAHLRTDMTLAVRR